MTTAARNVSRIARHLYPAAASAPRRWPVSLFRIVIPALAIGGSILVGMAWNIAPLAAAGALAAVVAGLVAPSVGLAIIALMGPLQPPLVIPSPGFNAILVGAVVLGCVYRLPLDRPRIRLTAPILLLFGFVLYVGVQQAPDMIAGYAGDQGHLVAYQFGQLLTGFGAVVASAFVFHGRSPYPFLAIGLGSAALAALLAIVSFDNPAVGPPIAGLLAHSGFDQRAVGSFFNPNYFGVFEAIAMVTAVGWMVGARSRRLRWVLLATSIVLGIAVSLSLSRGAMIALAAGLACLGFSRARALPAALITSGLLVVLVIVFPLFVQWRLSATYGLPSGDAYSSLALSDEGRLSGVLAGPQLFLSSPLFGIGWGYYAATSAQFAGPGNAIAAHNWYINVLAEQGTVGIVVWSLLLLSLVIALRSRPGFPRSMGFGVLGTYAVGSLFLEPPGSFQTSALPILVIVASLVGDWRADSGVARLRAGEELPSALSGPQ